MTTSEQAKAKIDEQRMEMWGKVPSNLEEQAIALVGRDIYETLIKVILRSNGDGNVQSYLLLSSRGYLYVLLLTIIISAINIRVYLLADSIR